MEKKFLLEIVTPQKVAYSEKVSMITVPTTTGIIGILARHIPLFALLTDGEVKISKNKEEYFLAIGGGFLEVTPNKTSILVTRAVHAHELDKQAILKAQKQAKEILKQRPTGAELKSAQALLRSTLVDLKVLRRRSRKLQMKSPEIPRA